MNKGKSFLTLLVLTLLLGLVFLPVSAKSVMNFLAQDPTYKFKVYLPVLFNNFNTDDPNTVPQGVPTSAHATLTITPQKPSATATPLKATSTGTLPAPTRPAATSTSTLPAPTRTATQISLTNTAIPVTPTRTPTQVRPTNTATLPAPTTTPTQPPTQGSAFTFLAWADTKIGTSTLASLSNQAVKLNPAFTLYSGDLQDTGFTSSGIGTWTNALNGNSNNGMFNRTFTLRGNHDTSNTSDWQAYFNARGNAANIGATQFNSLSTNLTYSFDYGNSIFILIDVPGDIPIITSSQIAYLDSSLAGAESRGLTHAFVFFHGPIYPVSDHTTCTTRVCSTPSSVANLIKVLNNHPIVSAIFNGHEHLQAYVHMDSSRVPEIIHPFEQFIAGSAGAALNPCDKTFRFDYCGSYAGFDTISVAGKTFTVKVYQQDNAAPVKAYTFTKP